MMSKQIMELKIDQLELSEKASDQLINQVFIKLDSKIEQIVMKKTKSEWMDLETTANYLSISRGNLSKFIKELDFPVTIIDQTKRCNRKKVDKWMEQFQK